MRPWLRQVCLWPLVEVEPRAPSQCANTWRPKLPSASFVNVPDEINQAYIGDLLRISEAFAAPLSNLFAFVKSGHPACPFITHKQLALYANPRFWQYGLLAFIARCCSFDNQHRHQSPGPANGEEEKSQTTKVLFHARMSYTCLTLLSFGSRKTRCDLLVAIGRLPVSTGYQPYRHKCGTCFLLAVVSPHPR